MRLILCVLLLSLTGCYVKAFYQCSPIEEQMKAFCEPCGGVRAGFANSDGIRLVCMDGSSISQTYARSLDTRILLGRCK